MKIKRTDFTLVDEFLNYVKKCDLSKPALADIFKVDLREIYRWERHESYPHPETVELMLKILPKRISKKLKTKNKF